MGGRVADASLPSDKVAAQRKKKNQTAMTTPISIKHPQPSLSSFLLFFAGSDGLWERTFRASFTWRRSRSAECFGLGSGFGLGLGFGSGLGEGGFEPMPSQLRFGFSSSGGISCMV